MATLALPRLALLPPRSRRRQRHVALVCYGLGALLLAATLGGHLFLSLVHLPDARRAAETAVERIAEAQLAALRESGGFVVFGPGDLSAAEALEGVVPGPAARRFLFEALATPAGTLRIRALPRPQAVTQGWLAPAMLTREISPEGRLLRQEWTDFTG